MKWLKEFIPEIVTLSIGAFICFIEAAYLKDVNVAISLGIIDLIFTYLLGHTRKVLSKKINTLKQDIIDRINYNNNYNEYKNMIDNIDKRWEEIVKNKENDFTKSIERLSNGYCELTKAEANDCQKKAISTASKEVLAIHLIVNNVKELQFWEDEKEDVLIIQRNQDFKEKKIDRKRLFIINGELITQESFSSRCNKIFSMQQEKYGFEHHAIFAEDAKSLVSDWNDFCVNSVIIDEHIVIKIELQETWKIGKGFEILNSDYVQNFHRNFFKVWNSTSCFEKLSDK